MNSKKIGIFGLGKSGVASAAYFRNLGYSVYVWDDSEASVKAHGIVNVIALNIEQWPWKELESLVLAPGIPLTHPKPHRVVELAKQNNVEVICDIEVLCRHAGSRAKFVGITGTNGKSTTTALVYHILKQNNIDAQMGGNIGVAALSLDLKRGSVFVLEVSSYQLDLLKKARFNVAALLNITPDHIDRYGNFENYTASKKQIFRNQTEDDVAIVCVDQEITKAISYQLTADSKASLVTYVTSGHMLKGVDFDNLPGEHNRQNIIAAFFICRSVGLRDDKIIAGIKSFGGLEHRMEKIYENRDIKFINDSKATNAEAAAPALKTFENIFWLAGGVPKEGGIKPLEKYFPKIRYAFFYGQAAKEFTRTYKEGGYLNYVTCKTIDEAFAKAAEMALASESRQSVVLLSPACASFDEFKNYEERGKKFGAMAMAFVKEKGI